MVNQDFEKHNMKIRIQDKCVLFLLCTMFGLVLYWIWGRKGEYPGDAGGYYYLSETFLNESGEFSFAHYPIIFRGYVFPFFLFLIKKVSEIINVADSHLIVFVNIIFSVYMFVNVIASVFQMQSKSHFKIRVIFMYLTFLLFWKDLILFPLTDMWVIGLLLIISNIFIFIIDRKIKYQSLFFFIFISGMLSYFVYNMKTMSLYSLLIMWTVFFIWNSERILVKAGCIISGVTGIVVAAMPQIIINQNQYGIVSLKVPYNLYESILTSGVLLQRYETDVSMSTGSVSVGSIDEIGQWIFQREGIEKIQSLGHYLSLVLKYPFEFISIYSRHFVNALDFRFNSIYIYRFNYSNLTFTILNYSILFLLTALIIHRVRSKRIKIDINMIMLLGVALPTLLMLISHMEIRYFLNLYVIAYAVLASFMDFKFLKIMWEAKYKYLITAVILFLLLWTVWSTSFLNLRSYSW